MWGFTIDKDTNRVHINVIEGFIVGIGCADVSHKLVSNISDMKNLLLLISYCNRVNGYTVDTSDYEAFFYELHGNIAESLPLIYKSLESVEDTLSTAEYNKCLAFNTHTKMLIQKEGDVNKVNW